MCIYANNHLSVKSLELCKVVKKNKKKKNITLTFSSHSPSSGFSLLPFLSIHFLNHIFFKIWSHFKAKNYFESIWLLNRKSFYLLYKFFLFFLPLFLSSILVPLVEINESLNLFIIYQIVVTFGYYVLGSKDVKKICICRYPWIKLATNKNGY